MMKLSKITYPDGTEKFTINEMRKQSWGKTVHMVMHPEHSRVGSRFTPILLTRTEVEAALK